VNSVNYNSEETLFPEKTYEETQQRNGGWSIKTLLRNIWFLRLLIVAAAMVIGVLLLTYSWLYLSTFYSLNNTTSYFPWAWGKQYSNFTSVSIMYAIGVCVSMAVLVASLISLNYVIPAFQKSLQRDSSPASFNKSPKP